MDKERVWIDGARAGNQQAFARLVEAYQRPVYNLAYRMLGNPADAEDAAQETFLRAYAQFDSYDPQRKFSSWLLAIAAHYAVDQLRRRRVDLVSLDLPESPESFDLPIGRVYTDPEDAVLERDTRDRVQTLLDRLPADYRLVIVLRYWHDLSYEEIAAATGSTVSAVKSRLHRARLMLVDGAKTVVTTESPPSRKLPGFREDLGVPKRSRGERLCVAHKLAS
jgi:RNA polymerase sigma-70 factor (ECF subfamily)